MAETFTLRPNGDVVGYNNWSATGTPKYDQVNASGSGDDTYIYTSTAYQTHAFALSDPSDLTGVTIIKVTAKARCKANSTASSGFRVGLRSGTTVSSWVNQTPNSSWQTFSVEFTTDPATGQAWTAEGLAALQWFCETRALSSNTVYVSQAWVDVEYEPPSGHDLEIADGTIALSADSPAITQTHLLNIADGIITLSADSPAITQTHLLDIEDGLIALYADDVEINQDEQPHHDLQISDGVITLHADSPAITQTHLLDIADGLIALYADSPALAPDIPPAVELVSRPVWLVRIGHGSGDYHLTDVPLSITHDGRSWLPLDSSVQSLDMDSNAAILARIVFPGHPHPLAIAAARNELRGQTIDVYKGYVDADGELAGDPDLLIAGRFDGGVVTATRTEITVTPGRADRYGYAPQRWFSRSICSFLPRDGKRFTWRGDKYVLRSRGA